MYGINPELNKDFILSKLTEEDIFEKYLCPVDLTRKVCSPLRVDNRPDCSFFYGRNGKLLFIDPSGHFFGDCFEVVKFRFNCINFYNVLEIIAKDFNLISHDNTTSYSRSINSNAGERKQKQKSTIQVQRQLWTLKDVEYWKTYHLNSQILDKFQIASCKFVWLNGEIVYSYTEKDPAYVYTFYNEEYNTEEYKIYFPLRKERRFIMNTNAIQGLRQLPKSGDYLIITKSLKDICCFDYLGIPSIAPQSESAMIDAETMDNLKKRFTNILTLFDFDRTGCRLAFKMWRTYGIPYLFFTNGRYNTVNFTVKDMSAYMQKYGVEQSKELIKDVYNQIL